MKRFSRCVSYFEFPSSMPRKVFCEALNETLRLPFRCQRIVSLVPALTETFFVAGLGEKLAGVSTYCVRPSCAHFLPTVGSYARVKWKVLDALQPDLVLTTTGYQRPLAEELKDRGYPVYAVPLPPSVSALISHCTEALLVAGYPEHASRLSQLLMRQWVRLVEDTSSCTPIRVYLEIDLGGPVSFGAYSYITDAFRQLKIHTPFMEEPVEWLEPDPARVLAFDPQVVLYEPKMFSRKMRTISEVQETFRQRGWTPFPAVEKGRIVITPGRYDFLAHPGPHFLMHALPWVVERVFLER